MLLIGNGRVITRDLERPYLENGAVVTDGAKIAAVGEENALRKAYPEAEYVDAAGGVIMPGLINAHTHIYSGLARGLSIEGNNPTNFLEILDHHASFCEIPGSLFAIRDVAKETGMRACLCYEVSERDGEEKTRQGIQENADFAKWAQETDDPMIKAMFGGHALFTISDKTFEEMVKANDGMTGFHIHVAEGMNDVYDSLRNYGCRPVNRLLYNGILGERTLLGHCIHVSPAEMDIIRETGTMVVNNPESNMGNAVGCAPVLQMMKKGITVGMGTDAYTHDMLESMKVFLIIQRHNAALPNVAWGEDVTMQFVNNRVIAEKYFGVPLGILKKGAAADVIVMDYKPFTPFSNENIDGHMLFGMNGKNCRTTVINGRLLYKDRRFTDLDEERINAWTMEQSKVLWGELNHRPY